MPDEPTEDYVKHLILSFEESHLWFIASRTAFDYEVIIPRPEAMRRPQTMREVMRRRSLKCVTLTEEEINAQVETLNNVLAAAEKKRHRTP